MSGGAAGIFRSTKFWIISLSILLAASIVSAAVLSSVKVSGAVAEIYLDGELIKTINLTDVNKSYSFEVEDGKGGHNMITVENSRICVSEANCPDQICVNQKWISDGVKPIICLPHRLVIEIKGTEPAFDAAS